MKKENESRKGEEVANTMIGKVVDLLFSAAKREIGYVWNYTKSVDKLRREVEKLKHMKGEVEQQISVAKRKGDDLLNGVQKWLDDVGDEISMAEEFLEQEANAKKTCFNLRLCVNLSTLYHYSKEATNKALSLLQHQEGGMAFESCVSIPASAPRDIDLYPRKNHDQISTQKFTLRKIIEAIEDESIQIIGIYGVGGVGKTTLALEVVATVKYLFSDVVFITVSQTVDAEKIKGKVEVAARRIMKGERILIILDDVWEELELHKMGIPCGIDHMNCKILLTSRSIDVCVAMNAQINIYVESLPEDEAWILVKRVVGERVETDEKLTPIAKKVAKECGGLPLIIQVVGNALKNKSIDFWGTVLQQLKESAPVNIAPAIRKAYTHLKLCYDVLEIEEAKTCFLLCSMFPEDALIPLELLTHYVMGAEKFNALDSIEDARNRVRIAVDTLKSSFLLLDGHNGYTTKMHDIVRDIALLIASEGENKLLVMAGKGLTEWHPRTATESYYTGISLMFNQICKLPDHEFHFLHLDTFLIQGNPQLTTIPDKFVHGMKEAKVLDMGYTNISSLPQSLKLLSKLRMLNLCRNINLHEISILGELKGLEILNLFETGIEEIPQEIGQLVNLRRLDIKRCRYLSHITPGVISKLRSLEELSIGFFPMMQEVTAYDCLLEVMDLSKLKYLDLLVPCFDVIPEDFDFGKLKGFVIHIGRMDYVIDDPNSRVLIINGMGNLEIPLLMWTKKLSLVTTSIVVDSIARLKNVASTLGHEGFNKLGSIELFRCRNVSCLVDTRDWEQLQIFHSSKDLGEGKTKEKFFTKLTYLHLCQLKGLEVIWNCPDQYISLGNLVTLKIENCPKLVRLFSVSVAQGLVNLQDLRISYCEGLEEVIWAGDEETDGGEIEMLVHDANIVFPRLAEISFDCLPRLKSFCSGHSTINYPSLVMVKAIYCRSMKIWGHGIHYTPQLNYVDDVPLAGPYAINAARAKSYEKYLATGDDVFRCLPVWIQGVYMCRHLPEWEWTEDEDEEEMEEEDTNVDE